MLNTLTDLTRKAALLTGIRWGRAVTSLGPLAAATVKDAIRPIGVLDYAPAEIRMVVDGPTQVSRLGACKKEPETVAWLERTFRPGDVLYDVGANVGAYCFVASAIAGHACQVYAFEPSFSTFAALCHNVMLNQRSNITPLQLALAARTGLVQLEFNGIAAGAASHRVSSIDASAGGAPTQPVVGFALDELVASFALMPPTHLKVDVDGTELQVLQGAARTLSGASVRSVLIEIDEPKGVGLEVVRFMRDAGYSVVAEHPRGSGDRLANVIFAPASS